MAILLFINVWVYSISYIILILFSPPANLVLFDISNYLANLQKCRGMDDLNFFIDFQFSQSLFKVLWVYAKGINYYWYHYHFDDQYFFQLSNNV